MSEQQQWEYCTATSEVGPYFDSLVELHLKPLGQQGWELIHIVQWPTEGNSVIVKAYLKRPMRHDKAPK